MPATSARLVEQLIVAAGFTSGTTLENRAALFMRNLKGVPRPEQQVRVGRWRLDFAWPKVQMAIEVDGWHHFSPDAAARDAARDADLRAAGWVILRVDDRGGERIFLEQLARAIRLVVQEHQSSAGWGWGTGSDAVAHPDV